MTRFLLVLFAAILLGACVSAPPERPADLVQAERLLQMGVQAFRADNYVSAAADFTEALRHYQGLDYHPGILTSRINLAETALAVGNLEACERHLNLAEPLATGENALRLQLLRSSAALHQGQYDSAATLLAPLLEPPTADATLYRSALANRVDLALARGDADAAAWVERYAAAARGHNGVFGARLHRFHGVLAYRAGDYAGADARMQQALDLYKAVPYRPGTAATLESWGGMLMEQQRWAEAEDRLQRALHIRLWLLARLDTAADLRQLATISEVTGQPQRATARRRWAEITAGTGRVDWLTLRREVLP